MEVGEVVDGRFVVERPAGAGGMGAVYRAEDRSSGSPVALKVLRADGDDARFEREADLLASIDHPGIVRYVAHGRMEGGALYLAMEWLDGETLAARLTRGRLTPHEAVDLGVRLARALSAVHDIGVVHRDVKPSNVLLVDGELARAKLLDFGVARGNANQANLTASGALLGTLSYMAPEQARGSRFVDASADVFALGCVLFECLIGEAPFVGGSAVDVAVQIAIEDAPRIRARDAALPEPLDAVIHAMMAREASARPQDGRAVARALDALDHVPSSPPRAAAELPPSAARSWYNRVGSKGGLLIGLVAGLAIATLAALGFSARGATRPTARRATDVAASAAPAPSCAVERCAPIHVPNPSQVDAIDLLPQAQQVALAMDKTSEFVLASATTSSGDGTVDLRSKTQMLVYYFQGKSGGISVQQKDERFEATHYPDITRTVISRPICSARAAWKVAVEHGFPKGTTASLTIQDVGFGSGPIWQVGTSTKITTVDGHTCAFKHKTR